MPCNTRLTFNNRPQRMCIMAKRVFDACIRKISLENTQLSVSFEQAPETFVSANSTSTNTVRDVSITPAATPGCARVRFMIDIPIEVVALDAQGNPIRGTAILELEQDVAMNMPQSALVPVEVYCTSNAQCFNGRLDGSTLTVTICLTLIIRLVADVDIVVVSCGYINLLPCIEYTENVCAGVFSQPLYPTLP